jgi:NADH-quinone oxidoreductase subunit M
MPLAGFAFGLAAFASIGLPGFSNFAGEVMVLFGTFRNGANPDRFTIYQVATVLGLWGVVISAVYMLRAYRSVFMGAMGESVTPATDLRRSLRIPIVLLVAMTIWFGFFPQAVVKLVSPTFTSYFAKP